MTQKQNEFTRLESLDILRGMDLFLLTVLGPLVTGFSRTGIYGWEDAVMPQMDHVVWEGFCLWDIIMPLFMFMSGVTIPFSMAKYRTAGGTDGKVYIRIFRRFVLLWILGMIAQGQLLDLNWSVIRFFSNTLQAIAVGYLFSALAFLWLKPRGQVVLFGVLLFGYWLLMMTVGEGNFSEHGNLCEIVDDFVLGSHRDMATVLSDGTVAVDPGYTYTWIVSSINFIATVLSGVLAGIALKSKQIKGLGKPLSLFVAGGVMLAAGYLWGLQMPVIKHIWTSSMVLVSSGWCFVALALVYFIVDYKHWGAPLRWLKVWGMNSILAYMMHDILNFTSVSESLLHGLEHLVSPQWYAFAVGLGCTTIECLILVLCYRRKLFLKV